MENMDTPAAAAAAEDGKPDQVGQQTSAEAVREAPSASSTADYVDKGPADEDVLHERVQLALDEAHRLIGELESVANKMFSEAKSAIKAVAADIAGEFKSAEKTG